MEDTKATFTVRERYRPLPEPQAVTVRLVGGSWAGRRVAVTGAAGFIGSHLVERLLEREADVTAFVRYNSRSENGLLSVEHDRLTIVRGDVRDLETISGLVADVDVVFHLAALVGIPYSYIHVGEVVAVNVLGTLNILTAAKEAGLERVIVASTSEVYGNARFAPMDESHPRQPQSPYAATKVASDAIAASFHAAFQVPVTIVRPFNTFGPRQSDRAIIPTIISQALVRDRVVLGNLTPRRDFTYVADTAQGFIAAGETPETIGEELNLGTGADISMGELARKIGDLLGKTLEVAETEERARPPTSEVDRLVADNTLARRLTGWEPGVSLEDGLERTIDWVRTHPELYDPSSYRV